MTVPAGQGAVVYDAGWDFYADAAPNSVRVAEPDHFYIAAARDEDIRCFEVAFGADGKARETDLLGNS